VRDLPTDATGRHPTRLRGRGPVAVWLPVGIVVVLVALLAALFAFGLGRNPTVVQPVIVGKAAPAFRLEELSGRGAMSLGAFHGQVVVLNFWASWCADCVAEHQALESVFGRFRDQGVAFVGVSFEDQASAAEGFARQMGMRWPLLGDPGSATAIDYGVTGVPETFVIAPDGRVVAKTIGPVSYPELSEQIARALPGGA